MKVTTAFALVATCIAASYSAPAPRAVDWSAVATKVDEIQSLIDTVVQTIKDAANDDNASVGASIGSQLDTAAVQATASLDEARANISNQSLSEFKAQILLGRVRDIVMILQVDLEDELSELTPLVASQIHLIFHYNVRFAEQKAGELYFLLRQQY